MSAEPPAKRQRVASQPSVVPRTIDRVLSPIPAPRIATCNLPELDTYLSDESGTPRPAGGADATHSMEHSLRWPKVDSDAAAQMLAESIRALQRPDSALIPSAHHHLNRVREAAGSTDVADTLAAEALREGFVGHADAANLVANLLDKVRKTASYTAHFTDEPIEASKEEETASDRIAVRALVALLQTRYSRQMDQALMDYSKANEECMRTLMNRRMWREQMLCMLEDARGVSFPFLESLGYILGDWGHPRDALLAPLLPHFSTCMESLAQQAREVVHANALTVQSAREQERLADVPGDSSLSELVRWRFRRWTEESELGAQLLLAGRQRPSLRLLFGCFAHLRDLDPAVRRYQRDVWEGVGLGLGLGASYEAEMAAGNDMDMQQGGNITVEAHSGLQPGAGRMLGRFVQFGAAQEAAGGPPSRATEVPEMNQESDTGFRQGADVPLAVLRSVERLVTADADNESLRPVHRLPLPFVSLAEEVFVRKAPERSSRGLRSTSDALNGGEGIAPNKAARIVRPLVGRLVAGGASEANAKHAARGDDFAHSAGLNDATARRPFLPSGPLRDVAAFVRASLSSDTVSVKQEKGDNDASKPSNGDDLGNESSAASPAAEAATAGAVGAASSGFPRLVPPREAPQGPAHAFVSRLRSPPLLGRLLCTLFCPTTCAPEDERADAAKVLAVAVCTGETAERAREWQRIVRALADASAACLALRAPTDVSASGVRARLVSLARAATPAAAGILLWATSLLQSSEFVRGPTFLRAGRLLVRVAVEIASFQVKLRPACLRLCVTALELPLDEMGLHPDTVTTQRRECILALLRLVSVGMTTPVLEWMRKRFATMDQALGRQFVSGLLRMARDPFTPQFLVQALEFLRGAAQQGIAAGLDRLSNERAEHMVMGLLNWVKSTLHKMENMPVGPMLDARRAVMERCLALADAVLAAYGTTGSRGFEMLRDCRRKLLQEGRRGAEGGQ